MPLDHFDKKKGSSDSTIACLLIFAKYKNKNTGVHWVGWLHILPVTKRQA